ncbi:unnamed protein product [Heligmosomoides polygyrus]|uniref:Calcineurin-like phosphoesterase domain-containing protein n=1 Tax=Heligmosomoides polygyrus TaxID=6339 RepID=A0A3P8C7F9_HELPZ|nr:unnamed protein product [Heligmosomoides polygyrus]
MLGERNGHWFDKLRREWQMYRSYRSALHLLSPDAVFFLGDLMDEGQWSDWDTFHRYADRFDSLFGSSSGRPQLHVLAGNHDLGFHYAISPTRLEWFERRQPFVLINSMALHGDGCRFCYEAELGCSKLNNCTNNPYRRPIVLQHFPLYRLNDNDCIRDEDFDEDDPHRDEIYRPKWEALSQESTEMLLRKLEPRAVFNGHAHRGCKKRWSQPVSFWEYTVNSFSWRNGNRPTFLMATISADDVLVGVCHLPYESTVINIYCLTAAVLVLWVLLSVACSRYPMIVRRFRYPSDSDKLIKSG